jgi:ferric enterobactin receptor
LSASYTTPSGIGFKIAAGRYYQYLTKVSSDQSYGYNRDFWVLSDQADHPVLSSNHLIAGTKFGQGQLSVDIEAWYKTYSGLQKLLYISEFTGSTPPTGNPPQKPIQEYINTYNTLLTGHGRSYGIDILFSYEKQHYSGWLSWSFGRAIQNFESINRGMDIPAPYDQPWSLDWTNMYTLGNWNFSSLYVFATGQPYIAFSVNNENLETGRLYKRMPNYHRFDISANYTFRIGAVSFKAGASIINLFNRKNYHDIDSRRFIFGNTSLEETSIIKSQGITPNVYLHFRF